MSRRTLRDCKYSGFKISSFNSKGALSSLFLRPVCLMCVEKSSQDGRAKLCMHVLVHNCVNGSSSASADNTNLDPSGRTLLYL